MPEDPPSTPDAEPQPAPPTPAERDPAEQELQARRRRRREALIRQRRSRSRLSEAQHWIFLLLALAFLSAWLFGRDACTQKITKTYGSLTDPHGVDGGTRAARPAPPPPAMRQADDGW